MIYIKPFGSSLLLLLLVCLLSIVFAQTPTNIENLNSMSLIPSPTENLNSSSSTNIAFSTTISASSNIIDTTSSATPSFTSSSPTDITPPSKTTIYNPVPSVQTSGFDSSGNEDNRNQQSWLRQNNRFVFVIFLGLIVLAILIWYIVRSIKGMRKRLEEENQAQLYMMQQASSSSPPPPPGSGRVIPELTQTPPPTYKAEDHPSAVQPQQPQQNNHSHY